LARVAVPEADMPTTEGFDALLAAGARRSPTRLLMKLFVPLPALKPVTVPVAPTAVNCMS
jgi:hypothetical protein